ncbi:hypothetical protein C2W62_04735 [Candidatus Entotheonella serta]|nr:hypothetical protein C2W62_04735 [Candidatus Entotheonella serta]
MQSEDLAYRDKHLQQALDSLGIPDLQRQFLHVPKGAVVLANYDLIHRGSRKLADTPDRFMYKFHYARTQEPHQPAWHNNLTVPPLHAVRKEIQPIVQQIWQWSRGETQYVSDAVQIEVTQQYLHEGREDQKVEAAYQLGMMADHASVALQVLSTGLYHHAESTRRASSYGLRPAGAAGLSTLMEACTSERPSVRRFVAYALGNVSTAHSKHAIEVLLNCVASEPDDLARSNAAYALGQVARAREVNLNYVVDILLARLQPGVEPNNTCCPVATLNRPSKYCLCLDAARF